MNQPYRISILLPTRNRVELLQRSVDSIINTANDLKNIEFLFAIDYDDTISADYIVNDLTPYLTNVVSSRTYTFQRFGYSNLNFYYNGLAKHSLGNWLLMWNDDAIMVDKDWDLKISNYENQFKLIRFKENHYDHPNACFPCIPIDWLMLFDSISPVPETDSWISQICYMNNIVENIDYRVYHDRFDLTGNNNDLLHQEKNLVYKEEMIVKQEYINLKYHWANKINWFMKKTQQSNGWFDNFLMDKSFDIWKHFKDADKNGQCFVK